MKLRRRWSPGAVGLFIIAICATGYGAYVGRAGYIQRGVIDACLAGLQCPYRLDQLELQPLLSASRANLDLGLGLAAAGVLTMVYILFFSRSN